MDHKTLVQGQPRSAPNLGRSLMQDNPLDSMAGRMIHKSRRMLQARQQTFSQPVIERNKNCTPTVGMEKPTKPALQTSHSHTPLSCQDGILHQVFKICWA